MSRLFTPGTPQFQHVANRRLWAPSVPSPKRTARTFPTSLRATSSSSSPTAYSAPPSPRYKHVIRRVRAREAHEVASSNLEQGGYVEEEQDGKNEGLGTGNVGPRTVKVRVQGQEGKGLRQRRRDVIHSKQPEVVGRPRKDVESDTRGTFVNKPSRRIMLSGSRNTKTTTDVSSARSRFCPSLRTSSALQSVDRVQKSPASHATARFPGSPRMERNRLNNAVDAVRRRERWRKREEQAALKAKILNMKAATTDDSPKGMFDMLQRLGNQMPEGSEHAGLDSDGSSDWKDMPLSPLMHLRLIQAREKFHARKPLPSKDPTAFEAILQRNPYAHLLTAPIRACRLTGARLPLTFLTNFMLLRHPESGKLWQLPSSYRPSRTELSFIDKAGTDRSEAESSEILQASESNGEEPNELIIEPSERSVDDSAAPKKPSPQTTAEVSKAGGHARLGSKVEVPKVGRLSGAYMLATHAAIDTVSKLKPMKLASTYPMRWKEKFGPTLIKNGHWREDMGFFIRTLIQNKVKRLLAYISHLDKGYVLPFSTQRMAETAEGEKWSRPFKPGMAVLWLGSDKKQRTTPDHFRDFVSALVNRHNCSVQSLTPSHSCLLLHSDKGQLLAVYNLRLLLGDAGIAWLRERGPAFLEPAVQVAGKANTAETVGWLYRLGGYRFDEQQQQQQQQQHQEMSLPSEQGVAPEKYKDPGSAALEGGEEGTGNEAVLRLLGDEN